MSAIYPGPLFSSLLPNIGFGAVCLITEGRKPILAVTPENRDVFVGLHNAAHDSALDLYRERVKSFEDTGEAMEPRDEERIYFPSEEGDRDRWYLRRINDPDHVDEYLDCFMKDSGRLLIIDGDIARQQTYVGHQKDGFWLSQESVIELHSLLGQGAGQGAVYYRMDWPRQSLNTFFGLPEKTTAVEEALRVAAYIFLEAEQFPSAEVKELYLNNRKTEIVLRAEGNKLVGPIQQPSPRAPQIYSNEWKGRTISKVSLAPLTVRVHRDTMIVEILQHAGTPFPLKPKVQELWRELEDRMGIKGWALA